MYIQLLITELRISATNMKNLISLLELVDIDKSEKIKPGKRATARTRTIRIKVFANFHASAFCRSTLVLISSHTRINGPYLIIIY